MSVKKELPPYSGKTTNCPKCGHGKADTTHLVKPDTADLVSQWPHFKTARQRVYCRYVSAGQDVWILPTSDELDVAEWYPDEWLNRECKYCAYNWDEQVAQPEDERPNVKHAKTASTDLPEWLRGLTTVLGAVINVDEGTPLYVSKDQRDLAWQAVDGLRKLLAK